MHKTLIQDSLLTLKIYSTLNQIETPNCSLTNSTTLLTTSSIATKKPYNFSIKPAKLHYTLYLFPIYPSTRRDQQPCPTSKCTTSIQYRFTNMLCILLI